MKLTETEFVARTEADDHAQTAPPVSVWLIEDNHNFRNTVARALSRIEGLECSRHFPNAEDALDAMLGGGVDYLFCNLEEAQVWCGTQDLAEICQKMATQARVVCLTRSAKGCIVLETGTQTEVPAAKVQALDTNGAGDMFAGAFLYAVTQGHSHAQAAWLANQCAARVVAQYGNRLPQAAVDALKLVFASHLESTNP